MGSLSAAEMSLILLNELPQMVLEGVNFAHHRLFKNKMPKDLEQLLESGSKIEFGKIRATCLEVVIWVMLTLF